MDRNERWLAIDAQRARIADLLDSLADVEWTYPSLCAGWTIHEAAAHVALAPYISAGTGIRTMIKARGNFNRMIDIVTREVAAKRSHREVITMLRDAAGNRRTPPGQTVGSALMDVHVHGQDIAIPLGRSHPMPAEAAIESANYLWRRAFPFYARKRLAGHRLVATDVDWSVGEGAEISGPIQALVMLLAGRTATIPQLTGVEPDRA
jgi:uncharacterized protein (TIGR03083 family)